jgi:hypothetical protein
MKEVKCQHVNHTNRCYGESIYNKVGNEKRLQLLDMVKLQGKSLKEAACSLNINYSTAKTILRVYRIENRILKKPPNQKRIKKKCKFYTKSNIKSDIGEIQSDNHTLMKNSNFPNEKKQDTSKLNQNYNPHFNKNFNRHEDIYAQACMNTFKILVSNLKVCISEVMRNETNIKKVFNSFKNVPHFNFKSFDMPHAFPSNQSSSNNYTYFLNAAPMPFNNKINNNL